MSHTLFSVMDVMVQVYKKQQDAQLICSAELHKRKEFYHLQALTW